MMTAETLRSSEDGIRREFLGSGEAARALGRRTALVEQAVAGAFEAFLAPSYPEALAVLAVGGFGRKELFPHSDVDLLLLVERTPPGQGAWSSLSGFLQALWDCGLRLSHSVRTVSECTEVQEQNLELAISLLDQRFLCGDRGLYGRLLERLDAFLHARRETLTSGLCRLARARRAKFGGILSHLEPNIKDAPGGLRDYHTMRWLTRLAGSPGHPAPAQETPGSLEAASGMLAQVRCFLHYRAGRDSNTLTFEAQEELAEQPFAPARDATSLMREYYRCARLIGRETSRRLEACDEGSGTLLAQFREWRSRVSNEDFTVSRERVFLKAPHHLARDKELALRLFQFVARHGFRLAPETERRLEAVLRRSDWPALPPRRIWRALEEMLAQPHAALALRLMHETGLLGALFPEWARVDCLLIRDFHHRYTVDEHTLLAIESLEDLAHTKDPLRVPFAEVYREVERRPLIALAVLFHDLGKASSSNGHTPESSRLAAEAMERIGVPDEDRKTVRFLIDHHLDLSAAIQSRDLDDPQTARYLASAAGTPERLKPLLLVTYADISAVHPGAMNAWRLEQLWRAYVIAYRQLTRELETERIRPPECGSPEEAAFLAGFPLRYLRTHSEEQMREHFELERASRGRGVALRVDRQQSCYRLTLVARDRPFLFASVAGALSGFGMNILHAEAFSNRWGMVLDTFRFADPARTLDLNPSEVDRLRSTLERVILGREEVKRLLASRPKPARPGRRSRITPVVAFDGHASETATLIEIVAEDRPGLLYDLAAAVSALGCNIEVVLIDTQAHKAMDVFYVTWKGGKLPSSQEADLHERLLAACRG